MSFDHPPYDVGDVGDQGGEDDARARAESVLEQLSVVFSASPGRGTAPLPIPTDSFRRAQERFRALVENVPAVFFMAYLDEPLSEGYVSPEIERLLGFSQAEWLSDPVRWYRQIHPSDKERWNVEAAALIATGSPIDSVYRAIARDGRTVWVRCKVGFGRDEQGRAAFLSGVAFDVTAMQEAGESLRQKSLELERANAELEEFVVMSVHDLQTPIRQVHSFMELLLKRVSLDSDPQASKWAAHVVQAATRMRDLITDALAFAGATRSQEPLGPVPLSRVLRASTSGLAEEIRDAGVRIDCGRLPTVFGRETLLQRLFENLIQNSVKYRRSGIVSWVRISAADEGRQWRITVRDNGIGFEPRYAERIFRPMQRLHTLEEYPGTGIGLAICRKIVESHGGRIWAEGSLNAGAAFHFTLDKEMPS